MAYAAIPAHFWGGRVLSYGMSDSLAHDTLALDSLALDSALLDSVQKKAAVKQLTVDSVLKSVSQDSILALMASNKIIEVLPDSTRKDSLRSDTLKRSKSALDAPVIFSAQDSITFDYIASRANLFGESKVNYQNLELEADLITMSLDSSVVYASGRMDTTEAKPQIVGKPVFKQGGDEYEPDSISYNFKTQKAFISNVYTDQGEGILVGEETKRDSMGVMYGRGGKYTTCDAPNPHFYLKLTRYKVRPGEDVVFGPAYLVVEDVPLPLAIPYGFFPFSKSYSSGFIMPTYGDETSRGFYLRDGGYYFAISDKIDLRATGEIYTKGSWGIAAQTNYKKRYKFSGGFTFSYQNTKEGEKNMPDYAVSKSFKVTWRHSQDSKANPTQTFSASVNFATSSYERNNLTSMYNPESYTQSNRTSSISYSKTFNSIGLTLSGTFNLAQNMRDSSLSVTLPTLNISLARFNPFKRKKQVGKERWYEKISMSYTGTLTNSISCKENEIMHMNLIKDWRNGMRHQVPVSASFTILNYINVTPSFNFTDRMYTDKIKRTWNEQTGKTEDEVQYGFYNVYNYNLSVSANTKLYGTYKLILPDKNGKKEQKAMVRHVMTPSIGFSYAPDFGALRYGFFDTYVKTGADGQPQVVTYSPYENGCYGTVSRGKVGNVSMDLSNNVEMKVRSDKDSTGYRKISLIDELGASLSYNMAAKSRPWSDLNMRVRLKLTKSYTFSLNALFATYAYSKDADGRVFLSDETEWSRGRFGRFQGMSQNLSYSFNNQTFSKLFGKKKDSNSKRKNDGDDEDVDEEEIDPDMQNIDPERAKAKKDANKKTESGLDEDGYVKFSLPWNFSVSYGVSMRENTSAELNKRMRYPYMLTHNLNFSGYVRIAENWSINFSSGWDFNYKKLSMTTASLSRDLHCFSMSCSMVIAPYRSFNFTFACKAGTLADALKWKKQSSYSSNIDWY
ncbi:MAG: LPS-assembly protein LptD [Bacteroidaceae bacterium]|nr:LPS-assembly protein LptD [Bacteroidaceae bacterium]